MMVTGAMEWRKVKEIFTTQMVMFTQVNSIRIELMVSEFMFIKMGKLMKDSGEMICKMVQEKKNQRMVPNMMECSKTARNGAKEPTNGPMTLFTQAIGQTTTSKDKVNIDGLMVEFTTENGKKINSMEKVSTPGQMAENTKENT